MNEIMSGNTKPCPLYGKVFECGKCKLCSIEALQQEYDELDAGHGKLFKAFCKMKHENELFRADITDANVQMAYRDKLIGELQAQVAKYRETLDEIEKLCLKGPSYGINAGRFAIEIAKLIDKVSERSCVR